MPLTQAQLDYIAKSSLDFYLNKGDAFQQQIQDRPLLMVMEKGAKTFPGGNGNITVTVQGKYGNGGSNDTLKGYTADDPVTFYNPANTAKMTFKWREHHVGISITHTELKMDGVSVVDEFGKTSQHENREKTVIINMLENKLFDFGEQYARSLNTLLWGDGTADAKALHGIRHFIVDNPQAGVVGGLDRSEAKNAYLRNIARTAAHGRVSNSFGAVTSNTAGGGALLQTLEKDWRQLKRYGGKPSVFLAGSDFINAYQREIRANGHYSQTGFTGKQDGSMGDVFFKNIPIKYDPSLDDLSLQKRAYIFDPRHIFLQKMQGQWKNIHNPARPTDKFVMYRSVTSTGQVIAKQLNGAEVIDIA